MRFLRYLWVAFPCLLCVSCEGPVKEDKTAILTQFTEPFPERPINFSRKVGGILTLVQNEKVDSLLLSFDKSDRTTRMTTSSGEEMYNGPVFRYRGTYFLQKLSPDSMFWFNAFEINGNEIMGFLDFESQLYAIDDSLSYYFNKPVEKPDYLTKCSPDGISVITDKKLIYRLYTPHLKKSSRFTMSPPQEAAIEKEDTLTYAAPAKLESTDFVQSLFPNPAKDHLTVRLNEKGRYQFFIHDLLGNQLLEEDCKCTEHTLNTVGLGPGNYLLTVIDSRHKQKQVLKLGKE